MYRFIFFLLFIFLFSKNAIAQNWTDAEIRKADTGAAANYLTDEEKNILLYMNLARMDGEKFYYTFLADYISNYNAKVKKYRNYNALKITPSNPYYISLLKHLKDVKNLPLFYPDEKLTSLSRNHAMDLKRNNIDTHESNNGDTFSKRLSVYFPTNAKSENIDFGYSKGFDIVCHLLMDCGVPSLGHRYNIIDQKFKFNTVGISIQTHPSYTWCIVIDFVSQPIFYTKNQ